MYRSGHWLPLPESGGAQQVSRGQDGASRLVHHGVRVEDFPDGALKRASQELPGRDTRATELPKRFGGGYLFSTDSRGSTLIWRAATFTAKLEPFARLSPEVSQIVGGFDRLYAVHRDTGELRGIDAHTGKDIGLGQLPAAPGFGALAFADEWMGVVLADARGMLASFDAGLTWHPLGDTVAPNARLRAVDEGIEFDVQQGGHLLTTDGRVVRRYRQDEDRLFATAEEVRALQRSDEPPEPEATVGPFGRRPMVTALLHGWRDGDDTALVARGGYVGQVRLSDGKVVASRANQVSGTSTCQTIPVGDSLGFVCVQGDDRTSLYVREGTLGAKLLESFSTPRSVKPSGNGGLVVDGPCPRVAEDDVESTRDVHCVRSPSGTYRQVRVRGDVGVERVVALSDGRAAVLIPPRLGAAGVLSLISDETTSVRLDATSLDADTSALVENGLWLDGVYETSKGDLATWVVGADTFVGVTVSRTGKITASAVRPDLSHTLFSGPVAFTTRSKGGGWETTDFGFSSTSVEVPGSLEADAVDESLGWSRVRGCSPLGCVWGNWVRVGFSDPDAAEPEPRDDPPLVEARPRPYQRFSLDCMATGQHSEVATLATASATRGHDRGGLRIHHGAPLLSLETLHGTSWDGFHGRPAPRKPTGFLGFGGGDRTGDTPYWAYVWGPRADSWGREARWQVVAIDPFEVEPPWASALSRSPWQDAVIAAQRFGLDPSVHAAWFVAPEPSGTAVALGIRHNSGADLYLVEKGQVPVLVPNIEEAIASAVKVGAAWYLGTRSGNAFDVYRFDGTETRHLGQYPVLSRDGSTVAALVRSVAGDDVALWLKSSRSGWYFYPIDGETGAVQAASVVGLDELDHVPDPCDLDEQGWLVESQVPLPSATRSRSNVDVDLGPGNDSRRVARLSARLIARRGAVCVTGLAADLDGTGVVASPPRRPLLDRRPIRLVLRDRAIERRYGFACRP